MNINRTPNSDWSKNVGQSLPTSELSAIVFNLNNKTVKIKKSKIKDIAKGLAEVAYSFGETNNPEEFAAEIADDIFDALNKAKKKREKEKKKKK